MSRSEDPLEEYEPRGYAFAGDTDKDWREVRALDAAVAFTARRGLPPFAADEFDEEWCLEAYKLACRTFENTIVDAVTADPPCPICGRSFMRKDSARIDGTDTQVKESTIYVHDLCGGRPGHPTEFCEADEGVTHSCTCTHCVGYETEAEQ